jgi:Glycoside-hydrolase family GH114
MRLSSLPISLVLGLSVASLVACGGAPDGSMTMDGVDPSGSGSGSADTHPGSGGGEHGSGTSGDPAGDDAGGQGGGDDAGDDAGGGGSDDSGEGTSDSGESDAGGGGDSGSATRPDGATFWLPTPDAPIHFHWEIGASSFSSSDILVPDQTGQAVYDIDGQEATAADVAAIHAVGAIAVCYVDVGSLEMGRPDYSDFPSSVIGPVVDGWPQENWLLLSSADQSIILPLMKARFESWCVAKGFDAIEPDNLDGWTNISQISESDNLTYDLAIANLAHEVNISIGLKNLMTDLDSSQYPQFLAAFDWALNEQCYQYQECDAYTAAGSFLPAGKAVFDVEYSTSPDCSNANGAHMNAQLTDLDLVGAKDSGYQYTPCVADTSSSW